MTNVIYLNLTNHSENKSMCENSMVPFTIIKQNNGVPANNHSQYKWEKLHISNEVEFVIKNITLAQEPKETLNLEVTLSKWEAEKKEGILYHLSLDFDNYLHQFGGTYNYEVVCKISRGTCEPDAYVFSCVERRCEKVINFEGNYASVSAIGVDNMLSSPDLYFCIRRLDYQNSDLSTQMGSTMSAFQNVDCKDCQVILEAKDGVSIKVHKFILSQHSDVFRAMFSHPMKEKQNGVVNISDVEAKVVQKMVDYLYTSKLGDISDIVQELFKLAHQYQLHELCRRCEEYYIFNVKIDNGMIVEILEIADLYELKELKRNAVKFVKSYERFLIKVPRYQKHLCQSINVQNAVKTLISADTYVMKDVKTRALEFIKLNYFKMAESDDFLKLFKSNPRLMAEIYIFSSKLDD